MTVAEAAAICAYVAERYPDAKLAPPPGDLRRGKYLQWLFFAPSCIEPALIQIFTKLEIPTSTAAWGEATQVFDVLDKALEKGPWLLGDMFTAADIIVGSGLNFAVRAFQDGPDPTVVRPLHRCMLGAPRISARNRHRSRLTQDKRESAANAAPLAYLTKPAASFLWHHLPPPAASSPFFTLPPPSPPLALPLP